MKNILVVDDSYSIRRLFERFLKSGECHVEMAANAIEAMATFKKFNFDLVFTDVELDSGISGIELAKWLRNQQLGLSIVIMSGRSEYEEEARVEKFNEFLLKGSESYLKEIGSYVQKYTGLNPSR